MMVLISSYRVQSMESFQVVVLLYSAQFLDTRLGLKPIIEARRMPVKQVAVRPRQMASRRQLVIVGRRREESMGLLLPRLTRLATGLEWRAKAPGRRVPIAGGKIPGLGRGDRAPHDP